MHQKDKYISITAPDARCGPVKAQGATAAKAPGPAGPREPAGALGAVLNTYFSRVY